LTLEPLEERALLSTIWTVNSLGDAGTGSGLSGDLRYVITQANQTAGDNTINFSVTGTITLNSALPDLSNTTGLTDIEGPGASSLTVARSSAEGTPAFGILTVDANVQAQLVGLTITGGAATAGGGILNDGTLSITNSTIDNNSASNSGIGDIYGGGIDNTGTLTVTNSMIDNNSAGNYYNKDTGGSYGGGIYNTGSLNLDQCTLSGNAAYTGYAPYVGPGYDALGGAVYSAGDLTLNGCAVSNNYVVGGDSYADQGELLYNHPGQAYPAGNASGGGLYVALGTVEIKGSSISGNSASGGSVGWWNTFFSPWQGQTTWPGGSAEGGGISLANATASITDATISGNSVVGGRGGGVVVFNSPIPGPAFASGGPAQGGGISLANATATITGVTISGNTVTGGVGGGASFTYWLHGSILKGYFFGSAGGEADGGGVYSSGALVLMNDTLTGNNAAGGIGANEGYTPGCCPPPPELGVGDSINDGSGGASLGGGIGVGGTATIVNDTVVDNSSSGGLGGGDAASLSLAGSSPPTGAMLGDSVRDGSGGASLGGGIAVLAGSSSVTIVNNTVMGNSSNGGLGGGHASEYWTPYYGEGYPQELGFYGSPDSPADGTGGGVGIPSGKATLDNTIVAQNSDDIGGLGSVSGGYNLIGTGGSGGLVNGQNGNLVGVANPGLDPSGLQNNGGPTQTIALVTGSPAIDAGSNALAVDPQGNPLATDQRGLGFSRIANGTVDIGAYEVQSYISGAVTVGWGVRTVALQTAADGLRLLQAGRNTDMPWMGINQVQINLTQPEPLSAGDVTITSAIGANYGPITVSGSGTSYTIKLTNPISAADRVTISIGNSLIARFTRRLDVLPGDVNDDGVVNAQDAVLIRNQIIGYLGTVPTVFGDINGDGVVDLSDFTAVRKRLGTRLP
jgi:hypothetical protein